MPIPLELSSEGAAAPEPSLRENFSWIAVGNVCFGACQWGIVVLLAKLGSAQMVGQFALSLSIATPIAVFFQFGLRQLLATDVDARFEFASYFTLRSMLTLLAVGVTLCIVATGVVLREAVLVLVLVSIERAIGSWSDIIFGAFQQRGRMNVIGKATILNGILSLSLMGGGVWVTGSLLVGVFGYLIGTAVPLLAYLIPKESMALCESTGAWFTSEGRDLYALLRLSYPLAFVTFFIAVTASIPRLILEHTSGAEDVGLFAGLSYLLIAGVTIVGALGQAASPRLAELFIANETKRFWALAGKMMGIAAMFGVIGFIATYAFGGWMLRIVYSQQYAGSVGVLKILMVSATFTFAASIAGFSIIATRKLIAQAWLAACVAIVCGLASLFLIPAFGLNGAAWSLVLTSGVQLVLSLLVLWHATSSKAEPDDELRERSPFSPRVFAKIIKERLAG